MAIGTEVDFDYVNRRIHRHASATAAIHSVNELYTLVQDTFDELTEMDDKVPLSAATPTSYKLDNGWYLEEEVMRHLNGGAIETTGYTDEIHVLNYDTVTVDFVASDIGKQVQDDAVEVGVLLDFDTTAGKIWVRTGSATVIADGSVITVTGSTASVVANGDSATGETLFANPYTLGSLFSSLPLYIIQNSTEVASYWADGHFDILIKVMEADIDIDSRKITVFGRKWGEAYTHFNITLTSAGQNAIPLGTADDLNVTDTELNIQAIADTDIGGDLATGVNIIFHTAGTLYDIGGGVGDETYNIEIDCNGQPLADVYEVTKWATRDGSTSQLINYGDLTANTPDDGQEYISYQSTWSPVVTAPFGTFAGGKFFGARGVFFTNLHADDAQSFQLINSAGVTRNPPNYQAFSMTGLQIGDRVAVYKSTGPSSTLVDKSQYSLSGANAENTITVSVAIPSSTPATGTIIVVDDDGSEIAYAYTGWSGSDFTVTISAGVYAGTETAYVPYLYATATATEVTDTTTIYTADIDVVGRVRRAGFKPYEAAGKFGSTGFSAIGTIASDPIYNL
jgi:hypothetical protein